MALVPLPEPSPGGGTRQARVSRPGAFEARKGFRRSGRELSRGVNAKTSLGLGITLGRDIVCRAGPCHPGVY
jgi:hypothetical protein